MKNYIKNFVKTQKIMVQYHFVGYCGKNPKISFVDI